ncbi:zinc-binding dehydrogenase [Caulobacter sp. S45]|uniref:quinone oxidoreductase family protein n=1 Tax=Caulobacter sp. S45 TaxID=1641861 RepID=UPI00131AD441|nr:zinc-binding dehydrogenase [Caulobacter sp. S45]
MTQLHAPAVPADFEGVGYTKSRDGFPLEAVKVPVPKPGPDQVLIHVVCSSLNPLEYKLAQLNFFGRSPPVVLGFDMAGVVVAVGEGVTRFSVGDAVAAMADSNGDGGWATGGQGGYALARECFTASKPGSLSFSDAAALPLCFIAAYLGLQPNISKGDTVYIPGGGGGVGHLAVQMAARTLGAGLVVSSAGGPQSLALARASGAHQVFDYKQEDVAAEIDRLTDGRGVDLVFDATYSEKGFVETAAMVREGGTWVVLGVGPGKTTRTGETESPVDAILAERGARQVNANMLRYFSQPELMDAAAQAFFGQAMQAAMAWALDGRVTPHIGKRIDSGPAEINAELAAMAAGHGPVGKVVVNVDRERAA